MKKELVESWLREADLMLQSASSLADQTASEKTHQFAVSMLSAFYGENSVQLRSYLASIGNHKDTMGGRAVHVGRTARGAIQALVLQINAGLVLSVRAQAKGEVFSDLTTLAHDVLAGGSDSAKNTAAVLVAAAYEDLVRTLGADLANVVGRPKLEEVINTLKGAGVLKGGNVSTAVNYLKFRNDSLHADWNNVTLVQVESCLLFVESLVREYMS